MAVRTKTDQILADQEEAHADDPERAETIACARRFKSSWIELGESLVRVRATVRWRDWGFDSFEAYAQKELHLKQETVEKLTGSYSFLKKRAPEVLSRDGLSTPIPSYQAVDFLARAEAQPAAKKDVVEEIRKRIIDNGEGAAAVARKYKEVVFPLSPSDKREQDAAGLRNVGKRLHELLEQTHAVPKGLADEVAEAVAKLLEALETKGHKAA